MASGMGFENTDGPEKAQAIAPGLILIWPLPGHPPHPCSPPILPQLHNLRQHRRNLRWRCGRLPELQDLGQEATTGPAEHH